jgi:hypothetical protein
MPATITPPDALETIPPPSVVREQINKKARELSLLRRLLRVAEEHARHLRFGQAEGVGRAD